MAKAEAWWPPPQDGRSVTDLKPQEIEIFALHQFHPGAHEPDSAVTQVVRLPTRAERNAGASEKPLCNLTIACGSRATIESAKSKNKPLMTLWRQRLLRVVARLTCHRAPQTNRGPSPQVEAYVERNDGCDRCCCRGTTSQHKSMTLTVIPHDPMIAIARSVLERDLEVANVVGASECSGCRSQ